MNIPILNKQSAIPILISKKYYLYYLNIILFFLIILQRPFFYNWVLVTWTPVISCYKCYINDMPLSNTVNISHSALFVDDLASILLQKIKEYLDSLFDWLFKWRQKLNVKKCCSILFLKIFEKEEVLYSF